MRIYIYDARSLSFHLLNSLRMYLTVLDHLMQIKMYKEILLSLVSNMNKCIIDSMKFWIGNVVSFILAYLNCD